MRPSARQVGDVGMDEGAVSTMTARAGSYEAETDEEPGVGAGPWGRQLINARGRHQYHFLETWHEDINNPFVGVVEHSQMA